MDFALVQQECENHPEMAFCLLGPAMWSKLK